jgi:hypothetical protein
MTGTSRQSHPLAQAQVLDMRAAGRERAITRLVCKAEALEDHDRAGEAACLWEAVSRLRTSARQERAQAAALRARWDRSESFT